MVDVQNIGPTSVVVLEGYEGDLQRFADELRAKTGCELVINLASGESLRSLDEQQMNEHGWFRG